MITLQELAPYLPYRLKIMHYEEKKSNEYGFRLL